MAQHLRASARMTAAGLIRTARLVPYVGGAALIVIAAAVAAHRLQMTSPAAMNQGAALPVSFTDARGARHLILADASPLASQDRSEEAASPDSLLPEDAILMERARAAEAGQQPLSFPPVVAPPPIIAAAPAPITIVRAAPATTPLLTHGGPEKPPDRHAVERGREDRSAKHHGHAQPASPEGD